MGPLRAWVSPQNQGHGSRRAGLEAGAGRTSGLHQAALLSDAVLGNQQQQSWVTFLVVLVCLSHRPLLSSLCCPSSTLRVREHWSRSLCGT